MNAQRDGKYSFCTQVPEGPGLSAKSPHTLARKPRQSDVIIAKWHIHSSTCGYLKKHDFLKFRLSEQARLA